MRNKNSKRILSVTIKREYDEDPDTSWLGKYGVRAESEYAIDRKHSEDCIINDIPQMEKLEHIESAIENDRPVCEEHQTWRECDTCAEESIYSDAMETVQELRECDCGGVHLDRNSCEYFNPNWQNYKGLPDADIRKYCRQDYDRMEELNNGHFCFIGIRAYAEVSVPSGQSSVQSEVSSGGLWGTESDSEESYLQSIEKEKLGQLRTELKALGFSSRAISTAFKTIERKED